MRELGDSPAADRWSDPYDRIVLDNGRESVEMVDVFPIDRDCDRTIFVAHFEIVGEIGHRVGKFFEDRPQGRGGWNFEFDVFSPRRLSIRSKEGARY